MNYDKIPFANSSKASNLIHKYFPEFRLRLRESTLVSFLGHICQGEFGICEEDGESVWQLEDGN